MVLGERHLRHLLANYAAYYNGVRTHLALDKDTPLHLSQPSATLRLPGFHHGREAPTREVQIAYPGVGAIFVELRFVEMSRVTEGCG